MRWVEATTEWVAALIFLGKTLQWHRRGLESTVGVLTEVQERATWERSAERFRSVEARFLTFTIASSDDHASRRREPRSC